MTRSAKHKLFRRELSPQFLEAAEKRPVNVLESLLAATEYVRDHILMPSSHHLEDIAIERKDTGGSAMRRQNLLHQDGQGMRSETWKRCCTSNILTRC